MPNPFDCIPDAEFETTLEAFDSLLESDQDIAGVLVDVDGVLIEVNGSHPPPAIGENVEQVVVDRLQKVDERFGVCLVTNRIKRDDFDPAVLESVFSVPVVTDAPPKPNAEIFYAGLDLLGIPRTQKHRVVMVGDSSYYDAYGAGRAGLQVYQVDQDRTKYPTHQMLGKMTADGVQATCKFLYRGYSLLPRRGRKQRKEPS